MYESDAVRNHNSHNSHVSHASHIEYADLLGVPFVYGGRSKETGFDCYGLAMELHRRMGIELPEFASHEDPAEIADAMAAGKRSFIELAGPEPGCLVLFTVRPPYASHVGMVLPNRYQFIHTMQHVNVCVERLDSPVWKHRIKGFYQWPR